MDSSTASRSVERPSNSWSRTREHLAALLEPLGDATFVRIGVLANRVVEIDRHVRGCPGGAGDAELLAFARGEPLRHRCRLMRIDAPDGPVGVLCGPRRKKPTAITVSRLVEAARALESLVPAEPADIILENGVPVLWTQQANAWTGWPAWPAFVARIIAEHDRVVVHQGAVAVSTLLRAPGRAAFAVRVARAERAELDPLSMLSPAQRSAVALAAAGATATEIAGAMAISSETVRSHLREAYRRLGVASRAELGALVARVSARGNGAA